MISQLIYAILLFIGFLLILFICELLYNRYAFNAEFTRKIGHILVTLSCLIFVLAFQSHWYVLGLGIASFLLLYVGKKKNLFKSIDSVSRKTGGSYLLPVSIYFIFLISNLLQNNLLFILPLLLLGISDPLAGMFGMYYKSKTRKIVIRRYRFDKTILGSSVFFVSALLICMTTLFLFGFPIRSVFVLALVIAGVDTLTEIISSKGIDNLSVPLTTIAILLIVG